MKNTFRLSRSIELAKQRQDKPTTEQLKETFKTGSLRWIGWGGYCAKSGELIIRSEK